MMTIAECWLVICGLMIGGAEGGTRQFGRPSRPNAREMEPYQETIRAHFSL